MSLNFERIIRFIVKIVCFKKMQLENCTEIPLRMISSYDDLLLFVDIKICQFNEKNKREKKCQQANKLG